ncbi:MAG TPA: PEGA domain-containing protein, partial [Vicinamibacterales bacterium]|nr:PEGA domain-containing protein [Vicinamibacterales bacterium]
SRLSNFRHSSYSRVRCVDRLGAPPPALALVSESVKGVRLSTLLQTVDRPPIDIHTALHLIRQIVSGAAVLHETAKDIAHGAIAPERIIITPNARVIMVEYVLGSALEQLRYSPEQYWKDLRVVLPPSPGLPRFDQRVDVAQIGITALSVILGRLVADDEYPAGIQDVLSAAKATSSRGEREPLPASLRGWLSRMLDEAPQRRFASALEARAELDRILSAEGDYSAGGLATKVAEAKATLKGQPGGTTPPAVSQHDSAAHAETARRHEPEPAQEGKHAMADTRSFKAADPRAVPHYAPRATPSDADDEGSSRGGWKKWTLVATVMILLLGGGGVAAFYRFGVRPAPATGTLNISSDPLGAQVVVDNSPRGLTPLTLTLDAGSHTVELRAAGQQNRTIPIAIAAGAQLSQYVELPKAVAAIGQLQVRTDPAGAQVTVDGTPRGVTPVLVDTLAPGEHEVVLANDLANVKQTVTIEAGATASLVVPLRAADGAPVSGWISVTAPVDLQLYENKKLIGSSRSDRIMVPAGKHDFEIMDDVLGYHVTRTVQVPPGKVAPIALNWPTGTASINALPWAEVFVDGAKIGETPLGNVSLPIGPHEITFRHPELGEQKQGVTITLKSPARISADLRKKP